MAPLTPRSVYAPGREPSKLEIIQLLEQIMSTGSAPAVVKQTRAALFATVPANENYGGLVLADPNPAYNGYYSRSSAAWVKGRGFPDTAAQVTLSGPANAQVGTFDVGVDPADVLFYFAWVQTPNTNAMTLNGRPVVNAAGNALTAGEWAGAQVFVLNEDNEYQQMFSQNAVAITAQNVTDAQDAAARAEAAAALSGPTGVALKTFAGDGVTTDFALDAEPSSEAHIFVAIDGVTQNPGTSYSVSGTTLSFLVAPPAPSTEDENISTRIVSIADGSEVPPDLSVTSAKLGARAVTPGKLLAFSQGQFLGRLTAGSGDGELLTAAQVWNAIAPAGAVVDSAYAEYLANTNLSAVIPLDDTIPQVSEGTEILTITITPKSAANKLRISFDGQATTSASPGYPTWAIFRNGSANALRAGRVTQTNGGQQYQVGSVVEVVAGTTSAVTISVRAGPGTASNMTFNGNAGARMYGGSAGATLLVEEIKG